MPSRDWKNRLKDLLASIAEIRQFTSDLTFETFQVDRRTVTAVLYNLAIIGEAARNIPSEIELANPQIPWADVRGMRNIVIHEYFQVNLTIVWQTIQEDLVPLESLLYQLLERYS